MVPKARPMLNESCKQEKSRSNWKRDTRQKKRNRNEKEEKRANT